MVFSIFGADFAPGCREDNDVFCGEGK